MARAMEPAARKAAIIKAATSCFSEKGYHATAVSPVVYTVWKWVFVMKRGQRIPQP